MNRVLSLFAVIAFGMGAIDCVHDVPRHSKRVGGDCDGCELMYEGMRKVLRWQASIAEQDEPGEPLEMRGVIYRSDGKTPAPDLILYVYHTDANGYYSPAPDQAHGRRHGHLRGWMKTDREGRYQFRTIRPVPYPNGRVPAHIHAIVKEQERNEYWIDEYVFGDDSLLTRKERSLMQNRGGSGVVDVIRKKNGLWVGYRDIVLGRNIPHYD
jgi:protocatechuate 3,4-dioxygenase beta subunit